MFGYSQWVGRAVAFINALRTLPGEVTSEVAVAPPLSESEVSKYEHGLRVPIPKPVREFLTNGSASCHCRYTWTPIGQNLAVLQELFPAKSYIYGGASLCNVEDFASFQIGCSDWVSEWSDASDDKILWRRSFPFASIGNGDYLALDVAIQDVAPVVYLGHDGSGQSCRLAGSFQQFLLDWEQICYLESWFWYTFADPSSGQVIESEQLTKLRHLFSVGP
jgi:hypothetical protein